MIRGPRQIAPREKLARFGELQKKSCSLGPARSKIARTRAISIDSLRYPQTWKLECGARVDLNSQPLLSSSRRQLIVRFSVSQAEPMVETRLA